jgi:hypothetical protein
MADASNRHTSLKTPIITTGYKAAQYLVSVAARY